MPELPEVTTIKNDLIKEILGKEIASVETFDGYPLLPNEDLFLKHTVDQKIVAVRNIGKLISMELSSGYYLAVHLNMSGNLLFNVSDRYVKIALNLKSGDVLNFSDVRKFGYFQLWDKVKISAYEARTGKNVLEEKVEKDEFKKIVKSSNTYIKNVLLNQKRISGLGNIYANDALHMSKIHPKTKTAALNEKQLEALLENIKEILAEGLRNRGSSIDRYKDLYGKPGNQQKFFRVYGKKGQVCKQCGKEHITYEKIQGRGTYFCENCQKIQDIQ